MGRMGRVNEHATEHLHVDVAVQGLYQAVVRQTKVGLEEHQSHLALGRKQRLVALGMLAAAVRIQLRGNLLQGELLADAAKFAHSEAFPIIFKKIELCEAQSWAYVRNFT